MKVNDEGRGEVWKKLQRRQMHLVWMDIRRKSMGKNRLGLNLKKYGEDSWEYQVYKEMLDTKYVKQIAEEYYAQEMQFSRQR